MRPGPSRHRFMFATTTAVAVHTVIRFENIAQCVAAEAEFVAAGLRNRTQYCLNTRLGGQFVSTWTV